MANYYVAKKETNAYEEFGTSLVPAHTVLSYDVRLRRQFRPLEVEDIQPALDGDHADDELLIQDLCEMAYLLDEYNEALDPQPIVDRACDILGITL